MGGSADRWVWVAFLLVLMLSGLIAYLGDLIGRRIGRKRLTIFGLRPKRTAILFTVVTGMLISGLAMALLLFASEGARKRILNYNTTVNSLQSRIDEQTQRRQEAQQRADAARAEVERTDQELNRTAVELKAATAAKAAAQQALTGAERQTAEATRQTVAATRRAAETQRRVVEAQRNLREAQQRRDDAVRRLTAAQVAVSAARTAEEASLARLSQYDRELARVRAELTTVKTELADTDHELGLAKVLREQARQETLDALNARDAIRFELLRTQMISAEELIVEYREELGRSLFRYQSNRLQIEQQLETFMRATEREAIARGAKPDSDTGMPAAMLPGDSEAARELYRLNVIDFLARATAEQSQWLRAVSFRNTVAGQAVGYRLLAVPDRLVFEAGQLLGAATMDGSESEAALARQLEVLIRDQVNLEARSAGLLPNLDGSYTRIGPEQWLPVLREIQQHGGVVTVEVVAAHAIRVGDELAVDFRVRDDGGT